jgi:hypothetical protein
MPKRKAAEPRKFYRTVLRVEILSDKPYEFENLADVDHEIGDGGSSGQWSVVSQTTMTALETKKALEAQQSDGSYLLNDEELEEAERLEAAGLPEGRQTTLQLSVRFDRQQASAGPSITPNPKAWNAYLASPTNAAAIQDALRPLFGDAVQVLLEGIEDGA